MDNIALLTAARQIERGITPLTSTVQAAVSQPTNVDWNKVQAIEQVWQETMNNPAAGAAYLQKTGAITSKQYDEAITRINEGKALDAAKAGAAAAAAATAKKLTGNGKKNGGSDMATGDNAEGINIAGFDIGGILTALGITGGAAGLITAALRTKWPWMTPEGEGFIAPWTEQYEVAPNVWGQEGVSYPGLTQGLAGGVAGTVVGSWTNAAKDGSTPATAEYLRMVDGKIYVRSLKTGVIKRVPKPRVIHVHSNMNLGTYVRAERALDRMSRRIAKRTKALKMAK